MNTEPAQRGPDELMYELLAYQKKQLRHTRLATFLSILLVLMVLGVLAALVLLVPRALHSLAEMDRLAASAQELIDNATADSNNIRLSAISYTDEMLENLEKIMTHSIDSAGQKYQNFVNSIQSCLDIVTRNRSELSPQVPPSSYSSVESISDDSETDED